MKRVPFFVPGFDALVEGGVPEGAMILVRGPPGAGKTIFVLQTLYLGALHGHTGIYFSFEEMPENLKWYADKFKWNIGGVQKQNRLFIYFLPPKEYERFRPEVIDSFRDRLEYIIKSSGAKIIVFDSVTEISYFLEEPKNLKPFLNTVNELTKKHSCVTLLTSHPNDPANIVLETGVDGIIDFFHYEDVGGLTQRAMRITKMRATKHPLERHTVWIEDEGMVIESL